MGANASGEDGPPPPPQDDEAYERMFRGEMNAAGAFEEAYADDADTLEGIKAIVAQLQSGKASTKEVTKEMEKLQRMVDEMEKKEKKKAQREESKAEEKADKWIEEQMKMSEADIAAEQEAKRKAEERQKKREQEQEERKQKEETEAQKKADRRVAAAEVEARRLLFDRAAAVIRAQEMEAAAVMYKLPLPLRLPEPPEVDELPEKPAISESNDNNNGEVPEYYKLLCISVEATFDEIKKAYRKQALRWHPDKNRHRLEEATNKFQKISEAFDTLYDAQRRSMYDAGKNKDPKKMKKLGGASWASMSDEADDCLTAQGLKWKSQSWRGHVLTNGRIDDDPAWVREMINSMDDPRLPMEKTKIFWRFLGEMAFIDREKAERDDWLFKFIGKVWSGTPSHWPKAQELKSMNDAGQQEWKERRLVYNRRRHKLILHIELHEEYMAISDREEKELNRLKRDRPGMMNRWGGGGLISEDPMRAM